MSVPTSVTSFDLSRTFTLDAGKDQPVDREKLVKMAQEFEGMLLLQMVRQMRQAMLMDEEEDSGLGNTTMTDTFDVEFANYLAKQGGIGLSKAIEQQIEKGHAAKEASTTLKDAEVEPKPLGAPAAKAYELNATPSLPLTRPAAGEVPPSPQTALPDGRGAYISPNAAPAAAARDMRAAHVEAEGQTDLTLPLDASTTSAFGWRADPLRGRRKFHNGVDLRAAYGTEVPTAAPGKVTFAGERGAYGLLVVVEHPNGLETRYAHLSATAVQPGDSVAAGQTIGRVGSSGRSTGPHLHFEVLLDGKRVNPEQIASARQTAAVLPSGVQTLAP
jgi:murein DD-endopeptidase MepM/ murein hydrolase activator NlpD